jgi:hypothetical protein
MSVPFLEYLAELEVEVVVVYRHPHCVVDVI